MSEHPEYRPPPLHREIDLYCQHQLCGEKWQAPAITDLGMTDLVNEEDILCPVCGRAGEIR